MPLYFSEASAAAMAGDSIVVAVLARFDFPTGEARYWNGHGNIELNGEIWQGLGEFASMSGIQRALNDVAVPLAFQLSGVDDHMIGMAHIEAASIKGRSATAYLQPFGADQMPLGQPVAIWTGTMDRLVMKESAGMQELSLICEGLFTTRSKANMGLLTNDYQQWLYPGDLGLEHAPGVIEKRVKWPT